MERKKFALTWMTLVLAKSLLSSSPVDKKGNTSVYILYNSWFLCIVRVLISTARGLVNPTEEEELVRRKDWSGDSYA